MKRQFSVGVLISLGLLLPVAGLEAPSLQRHPIADPTGAGLSALHFIPNGGQMDSRVAYCLQGKDKTVYFTSHGLTLALNSPPEPGNVSSRWVVKLDFLGANPGVEPVGREETGARVSYFRGRPEDWHAGLPTYSRIVYPDLWPGIDLVFCGTVNRMKYEFVVHPGSDPSQIRLAYRGASAVKVNEAGRLEVRTPAGGFEDDRPVAYQDIGDMRAEVDVGYLLEERPSPKGRPGGGDNTPPPPSVSFEYGFKVGAYDRTKSLVLDPAVLVYCGYIGGRAPDHGTAIAVDAWGNA